MKQASTKWKSYKSVINIVVYNYVLKKTYLICTALDKQLK
jgi:hypothetical protein